MWMLWVCVDEQAKAALRSSAIPLSTVLCAHSSYDNDVVCLLRLIISFTDDYQWTLATISLWVPLQFSPFNTKRPHPGQLWWEEVKRVNFFIIQYILMSSFLRHDMTNDDKESRQILSICGLFCGCSTDSDIGMTRHDQVIVPTSYTCSYIYANWEEKISMKKDLHTWAVAAAGGYGTWVISSPVGENVKNSRLLLV